MSEPATVLVVDDDSDSLCLLQAILEDAGFAVQTARSGGLALSAIAQAPPDLVLLDVRMPGMDGYRTCALIKTQAHLADIPVLFVSASTDEADRVAAFNAGGVDYVSKPYCIEEVVGRVRAHASLYRIRRDLERRVDRRTRELAESEARLRELYEYLLRVREEDRRHFARELHDELGQNLTALRIDFNTLIKDLGVADERVGVRLSAIDAMITTTVDSVRRICEDLRPGMLDDLGIEAALASYARRFSRQYGIACEVSLMYDDFGLDDRMSTAIFRIVQESLTNIARHAEARHAMVALEERDGRLLLTIADDGRGMPADDEQRTSFGMLGIRERVGMLGGRVTVDSSPGRGTHIEVSLPRAGRGEG